MKQAEAAKTERITILSTPQFKEFLQKEAKDAGISVSQLVRQRCEMKSSNEDEEILSALIAEVQESTKKAQVSLEQGLAEATATLAELRGQK